MCSCCWCVYLLLKDEQIRKVCCKAFSFIVSLNFLGDTSFFQSVLLACSEYYFAEVDYPFHIPHASPSPPFLVFGVKKWIWCGWIFSSPRSHSSLFEWMHTCACVGWDNIYILYELVYTWPKWSDTHPWNFIPPTWFRDYFLHCVVSLKGAGKRLHISTRFVLTFRPNSNSFLPFVN